MRAIKFRAWDKEENAMLDISHWTVSMLSEDRLLIMQYTGLHDKNGKEIYEGDILQYTDNYNRPITGVVQYLGNGFWIEEKDETHYMPNDREVIGNAWENPELIGGTQKGLDLEG